MNWLSVLVIFIMSATTLIYLFPEETVTIMSELKRKQRLRVIRRTGRSGVREVRRQLHDWAAKRQIDPSLVDEVITEHEKEIVKRLGSAYADEILGEDEPFGPYH